MDMALQESVATPIVDISCEPATFTVGGKTYTIRQATLGDYAACQEWIRDRKLKAALKAIPLESAEVRAKTVADLLSRPMDMMDIWKELEGECLLLQRCLLDEGKAVTIDFVLNGLDPVERNTLTKVLMHICGMTPDPTDRKPEEAEQTNFTSIRSDPNDGTSNSDDSAGILHGAVPAIS